MKKREHKLWNPVSIIKYLIHFPHLIKTLLEKEEEEMKMEKKKK